MITKISGKRIIDENYAKILLEIVNRSEFKGRDVEIICDIKKQLVGDINDLEKSPKQVLQKNKK